MLVKLLLWPGSVTRPSVAFDFNLLKLAEQLLLECHVSLKKFCDVLDLNHSSMMPKWVSHFLLLYVGCRQNKQKFVTMY